MARPEILAPAGDWEKLRFAVAYGADAVYLAGKAFGMRTASDNFSGEELEHAIGYCHQRGVKVYVTLNTMPRDLELEGLPEQLSSLERMGADGLIVADLGVLSLAKRYAPHCPIHISTQASVVNAQTAAAYYELGASRVVLARELTLKEIVHLRKKIPPALELEAFVHGAMCMAYSGRCLLSNYLTGRDANRGNCAQPCRWRYQITEQYRPGEPMTIEEDRQGVYLLNSKDLNMLPYLDQLISAGINSLKIEGRVKSAYYAAVVTGAYRRGMDLYLQDPDHYTPPSELLEEVEKVSHREYGTGFYFGDPHTQHITDSDYIRDWDVCAVVEDCDCNGQARLRHKNKFAAGEPMELLSPGKPAVPVTLIQLSDAENQPIELANRPHMTVFARLPFAVPPMSILRKKR